MATEGRWMWCHQILVSRRLFGTSLMFGVASTSARLHVDAFVNLLGEDQHSWALSHKGSLWHRGRYIIHTLLLLSFIST